MTRASGTTRGSAVSRPGTSFHSETCARRSARPSSVAVRSEPPRPERRHRAAPRWPRRCRPRCLRAADEARHDRHVPAGEQRPQALARRQVGQHQVGRGAAERPVGEDDLDRVDVARRRARRRARPAANICADSRSPRPTTKSLVRGVSSLSTTRLRSSAASSSNERSISAAAALAGAALAPPAAALSDVAVARAQRLDVVARASVRPFAGGGARRQPQQHVGHARGRRHHHHARPGRPLDDRAACRYAAASASDAPPNLWTSTAGLLGAHLAGEEISLRGHRMG